MSERQVKLKKCRVEGCNNEFQAFNSLHKACSPQCAVALVEEKHAKDRRKQISQDKKALRESDRGWWLKEAQKEFNKWIRNRDRNEPCISCGETRSNLKYDAGHYRSVGACPELRFEEKNCHKQCSFKCNQTRTGNVVDYRIGLIKKIGLKDVEWLEGSHDPRHYSIDDLRVIRDKYRQLNKEFKFNDRD